MRTFVALALTASLAAQGGPGGGGPPPALPPVPVPAQNPITPEKIANDAIDAGKAGAAIAHIHVRDPETGMRSGDQALFREVEERIRD